MVFSGGKVAGTERGGLFTRGALFASSRLIDRYEYDDAARRNHEEGVERQLGIDQNKYGQKEPKRDNKADLYVAEVPRRAWSLWHNGLGWAERLDNRKEPKHDNKADLCVAEVPRHAWSLWHNGLGRVEHLDNRKEPKRDNRADLYVAEVPRRAWSLRHN